MRGKLTIKSLENKNKVVHREIQNRESVVLSAKVGEQAWLAVEIPEDLCTPWHRVRTSTVKSISEEDDKMIITTLNSTYCLTKVVV